MEETCEVIDESSSLIVEDFDREEVFNNHREEDEVRKHTSHLSCDSTSCLPTLHSSYHHHHHSRQRRRHPHHFHPFYNYLHQNALFCSFLLVIVLFSSSVESRTVKVTCSRQEMKVIVSFPSNETRFLSQDSQDVVVYLDKLRGYPGCLPSYDNKLKTVNFNLPLDDDSFYSCGTSKLRNKLTGTKVFYHKVIIEERIKSRSDINLGQNNRRHPSHSSKEVKDDETNDNLTPSSSSSSTSPTSDVGDNDWTQESVVVKCIIPGDGHHHQHLHHLTRRDLLSSLRELPENFTESSEELIDYSGNVTAQAPLPLLNIAVKQNGEFVDTALNVSPGTPLEMIIYLDDVSANVYGLLTSFLRVTDNTPRKQEEIIILNGCSIDPYIFGNFETDDGGKSLSAKFRAFKFPDSNYVLFVGTVNVCLKSCLPVQCGEGQLGFGRRRRRSPVPYQMPVDANKVFEAELTTFVKVGYGKDHPLSFYGKSPSSGNNVKKRIQNDNRHRLVSYYHPLMMDSTSTSETSGDSSVSYSIPLSILGVSILLTLLVLVVRLQSSSSSSSSTSARTSTSTSTLASTANSIIPSPSQPSLSTIRHHHHHHPRVC